MPMVVEVALADGTKLVVEDASEDDVLGAIARAAPAAAALSTREGTYRVFPSQVVYVRYVTLPEGS